MLRDEKSCTRKDKGERRGKLSNYRTKQCHTDSISRIQFAKEIKYAFACINFGCLPFAAVHRPVASVVVLRLDLLIAQYLPMPKIQWLLG